MESGVRHCELCQQEFVPRNTGGRPQKFCLYGCKARFESALKIVAAKKWRTGEITREDLAQALALHSESKRDA